MTYEELAKKIAVMTPEQRNCDVTVLNFVEQEFYRVNLLDYTNEFDEDKLDPDHPFLEINGNN